MDNGYENLEHLLVEVVRSIASDQIILEHELSSKQLKPESAIIIRNKFNTMILAQLVYLIQNQSDSSVGAVSLLNCINKAALTFENSTLKLSIKRHKPLIDILADRKILISLLVIILALIKLENISIKKVEIDIRRRGPYVSIKFTSGLPKSSPAYLKPALNYIDYIMNKFSGKIDWRISAKKRVVFLRLSLSNQIPFDYNR